MKPAEPGAAIQITGVQERLNVIINTSIIATKCCTKAEFQLLFYLIRSCFGASLANHRDNLENIYTAGIILIAESFISSSFCN